jgi:hypothetical protein
MTLKLTDEWVEPYIRKIMSNSMKEGYILS